MKREIKDRGTQGRDVSEKNTYRLHRFNWTFARACGTFGECERHGAGRKGAGRQCVLSLGNLFLGQESSEPPSS